MNDERSKVHIGSFDWRGKLPMPKEGLKDENLCPEGLSRRPPDGCTYLRHPSQSVDLQFHGDPDRFKGPMNHSDIPDYAKPLPQLPSNSLKVPDGPFHSGGLGSGDGAHIGGWGWKI